MNTTQVLPAERYQRVTTRRPCAMCGKPDWCVYDPTAGVAICCRVLSDTPDHRFHGYRHDVQQTPGDVDERRVLDLGEPWASEIPIPEAEAVARDTLYREMARLCGLTDEDRAELHRRGLDDSEIVGRFFSHPPTGAAREPKLRDLEFFADERKLTIALWNLPGIYCEAPPGGGRGFVNRLAGRAGLALLVPDAADRFIAVQIRAHSRDLQSGENRYTWLSTKATPSHAPAYVARPAVLDCDHTCVVVTEGAFKALVAAKHYHCIAIGLPGITIQRQVVPTLDLLRQRGCIDPAARVCVAFDEELGNRRVAEARDKLARTIAATTWHPPVALLRWDGARAAKLDDALTAGLDIREELVATAGTAPEEQDESAPGAKRGPSMASQLVALAADAVLFHDSETTTWATIPTGGHEETWPLHSKAFKRWLARRSYEAEHKTPNAQALQDALLVLDGRAAYDGPTLPVHVRLAEHDGAIYLDLADEAWRAVKLTADGWDVVSGAPVKFRRSKGMLPLPAPTRGGTLDALRSFANLDADGSGSDWILFVAWLLAALRPTGPYPVLALSGEQGSAKSTLARVARALVDPNSAELRRPPKEERDLAITANNSWAVVLDNLSGLPPWLSDALCCLSTGGGFATRTLYENDEETIFNSQRPVILTGIEEVATRGDLVDRAILISLPTIPDDQRRAEREFWCDFEAKRPAILGALLDTVCGALRHLPATQLASLPRMADFAVWAVAAEKALSWKSGIFISAYTANRADANDLTLEASLVAGALLMLIEPGGSWQGTMGELHAALLKAEPALADKHGWPESPRGMAGAVKRIAPNLRRAGFTVDSERKGHKRTRTYTIARAPVPPENDGEQSSASSASSAEGGKAQESWASGADGSADDLTSADDLYRPHQPNRPQVNPESIGGADGADGADGAIPFLSNGHKPIAVADVAISLGELGERVAQLNAQGIHGDAAVQRALAERGALPMGRGHEQQKEVR